VEFYGALCEIQSLADLFVLQPQADRVQNVRFPLREMREVRLVPLRRLDLVDHHRVRDVDDEL
jgi:hypothetical protein